jgi:hypothetical protein
MRRLRRTPLVLMAFTLLASGCASAGPGAGPHSDPDALTQAEIIATGSSNLYDAVQRLRPRWLTPRAQQSFGLSTDILVFQGQTNLGTVEVLRQLTPESAIRLRFIDGSTAAASLPGIGSRHVAGAIILETSAR